MEPIIITLDGNIGAGKSTLLEALRKVPNVTVIPEPVGDWMQMKNSAGESLLSLFYKDTSRWCYTFQNCALLTRLLETQKVMKQWNPKQGILITERSVLTDRYVFAEMLHNQGKLDDLEWDLYLKWYNNFAADVPIRGIIHLTTDAATSQERIVKRGRSGEESIPLSYLSDLEEQHTQWIRSTKLPTLQVTTESMDVALHTIKEWLHSFTTIS